MKIWTRISIVIALPGALSLSALAAPEEGTLNLTQKVAALAQNGILSLDVNPALTGGDPAPGIRKKLLVIYSLDGKESAIAVVEGQHLNIVAAPGQSLAIKSATYGDIEFPLLDVTGAVQKALAGDKLSLLVAPKTFDVADPAPGERKTLLVNYKIGAEPKTASAKDGETLVIARLDDGVGALTLQSAQYGDIAVDLKVALVSPQFLAAPAPTGPFAPVSDPIFQYSVRAGDNPYRRAFLWIPENCQRVRGVIIGVQNVIEQQILADPTLRQTAAEQGLAMVWISPANDSAPTAPHLNEFDPAAESRASVQNMLTDLAHESGYGEIEFAPLIVTGHSAATPFVWGMGDNFGPERVAGIFPTKGWFTGHTQPNMPVFHTSSEYAEVGGKNWGNSYLSDSKQLARLRGEGENHLVSEFVDIGSGHYNWNPNMAPVLALWIKKVAQKRIPLIAPTTGLVQLNVVDPKSGWLIAPDQLGTPGAQIVSAQDFTGDATKAFWYFDRELAQAVNDYITAGLAKKPQILDVLDGSRAARLNRTGAPHFNPEVLADGISFRVKAGYLDQSPVAGLDGGAGTPVGHPNSPISFEAGAGPIRQTGPDTFQAWMKRGTNINRTELVMMAIHPGDGQYRRAERPAFPNGFSLRNAAGTPQTIDFPAIANQSAGTKSLTLLARSDAGLPVQFFVVSGPAQLDPNDNTRLNFTPIPPRSKQPVRVVIGAYQWGRITPPLVQNATPVFQEFTLTQ